MSANFGTPRRAARFTNIYRPSKTAHLLQGLPRCQKPAHRDDRSKDTCVAEAMALTPTVCCLCLLIATGRAFTPAARRALQYAGEDQGQLHPNPPTSTDAAERENFMHSVHKQTPLQLIRPPPCCTRPCSALGGVQHADGRWGCRMRDLTVLSADPIRWPAIAVGAPLSTPVWLNPRLLYECLTGWSCTAPQLGVGSSHTAQCTTSASGNRRCCSQAPCLAPSLSLCLCPG